MSLQRNNLPEKTKELKLNFPCSGVESDVEK